MFFSPWTKSSETDLDTGVKTSAIYIEYYVAYCWKGNVLQ